MGIILTKIKHESLILAQMNAGGVLNTSRTDDEELVLQELVADGE